MLHYYRFHDDLPHPMPAKPVYPKRGKGGGWPEHCPPIRAANAFGWDVINPFAMRFLRDKEGNWDIEEAVEVESDIEFEGGVRPHPQMNAWFWEKGQERPHVITDNVYAQIRHQVKVTTFLYLRTDPGEMLWLRGVPSPTTPLDSPRRHWSVIEAVIETDWYFPAHPWHGVIELPRIEEHPAIDEVIIPEGEPLFRLVPLTRDDYEARELGNDDFGIMFAEGQKWLAAHGREPIHGELDITGTYAKQQRAANFLVRKSGNASS